MRNFGKRGEVITGSCFCHHSEQTAGVAVLFNKFKVNIFETFFWGMDLGVSNSVFFGGGVLWINVIKKEMMFQPLK